MADSLHPIRIQQIKNTTLPLPLFYYDEDNENYITQAMYISNISENNSMFMPSTITVVRESSTGLKTTAVYKMVTAIKTNDSDFMLPQDN